eukprot:TRINITY_DN2640_c0_g1_i1.p1 TRINITY_DN2640_c0_g1~~TRINITY_DN2640_c0_g1_i1.p1  ORF type:complete len:359 (-),score=3.86 TRINITY_DN2640_c0_g1_i1:476-1552(-)
MDPSSFSLLGFLTTILFSRAKGIPREERIIGLFNIVTFGNVECTGHNGVCFAIDECTNRGGISNGNCASGFGVCCVLSTSTCGSTVTRNVTFIQNPGFPTPITNAQNCEFTIRRLSSDICQLRLDFNTLRLAEPADSVCGKSGTMGANSGDKITVKGGLGFNPPGNGGLCGSNLDGQHMYVEFGASDTIMWSAAIGSDTGVSRTWNIKTSQIPCNSNFKAPMGCVQYFTGPMGTISSYNRAGMRAPAGSIYQNCIRREEGKCSIEYMSNFFKLGVPRSTTGVPVSQSSECTNAGVTIPNAIGASTNTFCLEIFNGNDGQTMNGVIKSEEVPFRLGVSTQKEPLTSVLGFELSYRQHPC